MKNLTETYSAVFTLLVVGPCLLAAAQKITPGLYGVDEWLENPRYEANTDSFWAMVEEEKFSSDGKCVQSITIGGKGVLDVKEVECNTIPIVFADDYEILVGNNTYSSTPGTLYFFNRDHSCYEKLYSTKRGRMSTITKNLSIEQCYGVRRRMRDALTDIGQDIIGEKSRLWNIYKRKLDQEFADLGKGSVGNSELTIDINPSTASSVGYGGVNVPDTVTQKGGAHKPALTPIATNFMGGWSISKSAPYSLPNGNVVKMLKIKVPAGRVAGKYEIPASEKIGLTVNNNRIFIGNNFFSDARNTLVILSGDRCIKEIHSGSSSPKVEDITASARCKSIRTEMMRLNGKKRISEVFTNTNGPINTNNDNYNGNSINNNGNSGGFTQSDNQAPQNNRVAQQLSQVAETLVGVVNKLASQLSVDGQPNPLLQAMGDTLSKISLYLKNNFKS